VSEDEDDEALTWVGGRDPSHYETPEVKAPKAERPTRRSRGGAVEAGDDETDELPPATSSILLITMGVLAGIYLLYTIGWIVSLQRFPYFASDALDQAGFTAQQYLAAAAPALWFATTLVLTRKRAPLARLLWLVCGAILLVPWSFVLGS
jgi:hypothetical protein